MPDTNPSLRQYDPAQLLDAVSAKLLLKNDASLARMLEVQPPMLSKIRHRRLPVGSALLIRFHEVTGLPIAQLRALMGDRRAAHRIGARPGPLRPDQATLHGISQDKRRHPPQSA